MCYGSIRFQFDALKAGFNKVIPNSLLVWMTADDLEKIICGAPTIDLADWKNNTTYKPPYTEDHKVIHWMWRVLGTYTQKQLSSFVQFCTGTSRVPAGGFAALESNRGQLSKFAVHATPYSKTESPYPQAHTCFNRLILPLYPSYDELKRGLDFVTNNEVTGFGID